MWVFRPGPPPQPLRGTSASPIGYLLSSSDGQRAYDARGELMRSSAIGVDNDLFSTSQLGSNLDPR
eukprot:2596239-Amphidinium_carterae.1